MRLGSSRIVYASSSLRGPHLDVAVELDLRQRRDRGVEQLLDREVAAGGHVVVPVAGAVDDRLHDDVDQVVDVDEVAPRVHHEHALALGQPVVEGRQRAGDVARPVGVGEPERQEVDARQLDVQLAGRLRDAVAGVRPDRVVERDRLLGRRRAVAERGLEVEEPLDAGGLRGLDDVDRAERVRHDVRAPGLGVLVRRGGVDDEVGPEALERVVDGAGVLDRVLHDLEPVALGQVVAPPGGVVVDDEDLVALIQQPIGEVRADEAGSARDQDLHLQSPSSLAGS